MAAELSEDSCRGEKRDTSQLRRRRSPGSRHLERKTRPGTRAAAGAKNNPRAPGAHPGATGRPSQGLQAPTPRHRGAQLWGSGRPPQGLTAPTPGVGAPITREPGALSRSRGAHLRLRLRSGRRSDALRRRRGASRGSHGPGRTRSDTGLPGPQLPRGRLVLALPRSPAVPLRPETPRGSAQWAGGAAVTVAVRPRPTHPPPVAVSSRARRCPLQAVGTLPGRPGPTASSPGSCWRSPPSRWGQLIRPRVHCSRADGDGRRPRVPDTPAPLELR